MNRLSEYNTVKILYLLCVIAGFILLFLINPINEGYYTVIKTTGFVLIMYGLFNISTKQIKNEEEPPENT